MLTLQQFGNFGPSIYTTKCMVHSLLFHLDLLSLMLFWSRCKLLFWRGGGSCFKVTKEKQKAKCFLLKKHKQRTLCWLCPNCSGLFRSKIESWEAVNGWTTQTKPIYSLIKRHSFNAFTRASWVHPFNMGTSSGKWRSKPWVPRPLLSFHYNYTFLPTVSWQEKQKILLGFISNKQSSNNI